MDNNKQTPILGFAAYSGTGKTTLLEKLIPELKARGLKIAVVKHDAHGLTFDHEGKDSWRFSHAGADYSIVSGPDQAAVFMSRALAPEEAFAFVPNADLILVEGYKQGNFSQIGIARKATGKGLTADISRFVAVVTDDEDIIKEAERLSGSTGRQIPIFRLDEIEKIATFIADNMPSFSQVDP